MEKDNACLSHALLDLLIIQMADIFTDPAAPPVLVSPYFADPFPVPFLGPQDILEKQAGRRCWWYKAFTKDLDRGCR